MEGASLNMIPMGQNPNPIRPEQVSRLGRALQPGPVLILTHHNPDPDALAAGQGLEWLIQQRWGYSLEKIYTGLVSRSENMAVLNHLTPGWTALPSFTELNPQARVILVDTQPGATNNMLPPDRIPAAVFDHHMPSTGPLDQVPYLELRTEVGSTATLVYQYIEAAGLEIPPRLATALLYGIKTDTNGLTRGSSIEDEYAYLLLLKQIDREALILVENAQRPAIYYQQLVRGIEGASVYGSAVVLYLGELHRPDFTADMAEELIRLEDARAALCMGRFQDKLYLSVRTLPSDIPASRLLERVIRGYGRSGGHGVVAGGQVLLSDREPSVLARGLIEGFVIEVGEDPKSSHPLLR
jgi:nanoRNase/pAp phosphatase (c-di-AMP/oligoRNAs hydrolase)